jgi:hypothetical protein
LSFVTRGQLKGVRDSREGSSLLAFRGAAGGWQ